MNVCLSFYIFFKIIFEGKVKNVISKNHFIDKMQKNEIFVHEKDKAHKMIELLPKFTIVAEELDNFDFLIFLKE